MKTEFAINSGSSGKFYSFVSGKIKKDLLLCKLFVSKGYDLSKFVYIVVNLGVCVGFGGILKSRNTFGACRSMS